MLKTQHVEPRMPIATIAGRAASVTAHGFPPIAPHQWPVSCRAQPSSSGRQLRYGQCCPPTVAAARLSYHGILSMVSDCLAVPPPALPTLWSKGLVPSTPATIYLLPPNDASLSCGANSNRPAAPKQRRDSAVILPATAIDEPFLSHLYVNAAHDRINNYSKRLTFAASLLITSCQPIKVEQYPCNLQSPNKTQRLYLL